MNVLLRKEDVDSCFYCINTDERKYKTCGSIYTTHLYFSFSVRILPKQVSYYVVKDENNNRAGLTLIHEFQDMPIKKVYGLSKEENDEK